MTGIGEKILVGFGDVVDRIIATPSGVVAVKRKGRDGPYKTGYDWVKVYDETRERYGRPLTLLAAERLREEVGRGDYVFIFTNSFEMDGPPGAAALARALIMGLEAIPVILANYEEGTKFEKAIPQSCTGAEIIPVHDPSELRGSIFSPYTVLILNWPKTSVSQAKIEAERLLDEYKPKAVVTVEALSCNKKGVIHGAMGGPLSNSGPDEKIERWNEFFDAAKTRGILTIATGDNGNECGFATIKDILKRHHPFCADCGCPCGEGIISAVGADIVIPGVSSNWACYGIEACLAKLVDRPEIMHDEYTEKRMLLNCANVGIPDGATAMCTPTIDGASREACIHVVGMLRQTVVMSGVEIVRHSR